MADESPILDSIPESDGGTTNGGHDSGGVGTIKDPVENSGQLLGDEQRLYIREIAQRSYTAAQASNGIWLQDVILAGSDERANELGRIIQGYLGSYTRSVHIVSVHDSHVHVLHECNYHNGQCRCDWKKKTLQQEGIEFRRRLQRQRRRRARELDIADWQRIYLYFSTEGRRKKASYINGKVQALPCSSEDLAKQRLTRPRREGSELAGKEGQDLEGDADDLRRLFEDGQSNPSIRGQCDETSRGTKRKRQEDQTIFSQLQTILGRYPVAPLINIVDHPVYLESPLARFRSSSCKVQDGVDVFGKKLMRYTTEDFYTNIYSKPDCVPIFSAGHMSIDNYYYDIEDSLDIVNKLLMFQFDHDEESVHNFVRDLFNILDRNIPKCNTILVHSPPSGGKNFFFDMVMDYYLNRGQLGMANKHNNFAFQEAYGKRIIMWNEPNYEAAMTDQLKMMTAGDAYTVTVKNKPDAAVYKTPIVILTNNHLNLMGDVAFKDRIKQFKWKTASFLKDCNKKPYPIALYYMFKNFGLIK